MNSKELQQLAAELNALDTSKIYTFNDPPNVYKLLIIQRGEALFFSENGKSFIAEDFSALHAKISLKGINKWIEGGTIQNKDELISKLRHYYKIAYKDDLEVI